VKKYSDDYFEKKYIILFDKLLQKEGFVDDIKATRKELGLPVNGFANGPELAFFFINKLTKDQQHSLTFFAFLRAYENEHKMRVSDENREEVIKAFMKEYKKGIGMVPMMVELGYTIETHHNLFTKYPFFEGNKYLSKLYKSVFKLMQKY
jgi:ribosomal protein S8